MNKTALFPKLVIIFILPLTVFLLSGCTSTQVEQSTDREPWLGTFTGMIKADLKMFFSRSEDEEDVYIVKGAFSGNIETVAGGHGGGKMNGSIKGKIKDGIVDFRINGSATGDWGSVPISGKMIGTLSKTQVFGKWNISAQAETQYYFSGEWRAEKIDAASEAN